MREVEIKCDTFNNILIKDEFNSKHWILTKNRSLIPLMCSTYLYSSSNYFSNYVYTNISIKYVYWVVTIELNVKIKYFDGIERSLSIHSIDRRSSVILYSTHSIEIVVMSSYSSFAYTHTQRCSNRLTHYRS